nr:uncharacterized protein LOC117279438 [Nicotiana tomentosiformis]
MRSLIISSTESFMKTLRHLGRCAQKQHDLASKEANYTGNLSKARCLGAFKVNYVIREVHEGICGNYLDEDSVVLKLVRAGYYWPRMEHDAKDSVQKCDKCQRYAPLVHQPAELLHSVLSPWMFMKWGMDIIRPLPLAPGPYQKIGEREVKDFVWEYIICRLGIPKEIACDNEPQFIGTNGQEESTNKLIIQNLKKWLEAAKGRWPEELS